MSIMVQLPEKFRPIAGLVVAGTALTISVSAIFNIPVLGGLVHIAPEASVLQLIIQAAGVTAALASSISFASCLQAAFGKAEAANVVTDVSPDHDNGDADDTAQVDGAEVAVARETKADQMPQTVRPRRPVRQATAKAMPNSGVVPQQIAS